MQRAALLVLVLVLGTPAAATRAQERAEPARGLFLVARPKVKPGPFFRSVVLLLDHGEIGTLGLVVNHPTPAAVSDVLPELGTSARAHILYIGGPVGLESPVVLFRSKAPPEGVAPVMEDVYYTGDRGLLGELLKEERGVHGLRIFLGHSGWAPGQLDEELRLGNWEVVRADADTLFHTEPGRLWDHLSMISRTYARASGAAMPSSSATP